MSEVTQILREIREGKEQSAEQLLALVYTELKRIAAQKMAGEAPGNTLQPTALVHVKRFAGSVDILRLLRRFNVVTMK